MEELAAMMRRGPCIGADGEARPCSEQDIRRAQSAVRALCPDRKTCADPNAARAKLDQMLKGVECRDRDGSSKLCPAIRAEVAEALEGSDLCVDSEGKVSRCPEAAPDPQPSATDP